MVILIEMSICCFNLLMIKHFLGEFVLIRLSINLRPYDTFSNVILSYMMFQDIYEQKD